MSRRRTRSSRLPVAVLVTAAALVSAAARPDAAPAAEWPFRPGEVLTYQVRVSRVGEVGTGRMWIEGPVTEGGRTTWLLRFEMEAGKGPVRASDRTASWLDPTAFTTLRFEKVERHLLSRSEEQVRIDAAAGRWIDSSGRSGELAARDPLDELSFIYLLRTLPLEVSSVESLTRHFDAARNPTIIRVTGRDTITTPAGIFRTRVVEMEVRDPKRYRGRGMIRLHIDDGPCRLPVRIESRMPVLGVTTLTLTGWRHPPGYPDAEPCGL